MSVSVRREPLPYGHTYAPKRPWPVFWRMLPKSVVCNKEREDDADATLRALKATRATKAKAVRLMLLLLLKRAIVFRLVWGVSACGESPAVAEADARACEVVVCVCDELGRVAWRSAIAAGGPCKHSAITFGARLKLESSICE